MRRCLWLCLPLLLTSGCAPRADRPVARAVLGDLPLVMVESGEIAAVRTELIRPPQDFETPLVIVKMVPEGTVVAQGDTLVWLDASPFRRALADVDARLENLATQRAGVVADQASRRQELVNAVAMAELSRDQAELQLQKLRFESQTRQQEARLAANRAANALTEARAKLAAQASLDSLELAKADVDLAIARSERKTLRERFAGMAIRAPLAGMVVYYEQEDRQGKRTKPRVGDTADPWRPIVQIPDLSAMQVEMSIHEVDRHRVAAGMPVRVRLEAYPESVLTGRITTIARLATPVESESSVRGFATVASLDGTDPRLRPGMSAVVEIELGRVAGAVLVPRAALHEMDGQAVVFPRAAWPAARPVRVAALTPLLAAVTEGVAVGTDLVVGPPPDAARALPLGAARHFAGEKP